MLGRYQDRTGKRDIRRGIRPLSLNARSLGGSVGGPPTDAVMFQDATVIRRALSIWNESRTKRARIADSADSMDSFTAICCVNPLETYYMHVFSLL
jgi:hypothetical protein